jgi:hypothetical protein
MHLPKSVIKHFVGAFFCALSSNLSRVNTNYKLQKIIEHEAVEHDFLVERWHEIESVLWNAKLVLKEHNDVETVARSVAESAVKYEMLHHSLLEHAVLHARHKLDGASRTDIS